MTASPIATARLIPATFTAGFSKGRTTNRVLVDPLTGIHYCPECDYTADRIMQVIPHLSIHAPKKPEKKGQKPDLGARIDQIAALLNEVRAEFVDIDDPNVDPTWKARAQAAERRLAQLRKALGTDS